MPDTAAPAGAGAGAAAEGLVRIVVETTGDRVAAVRVVRQHPPAVGRVLIGRPVADAVAALPRLFALCATAQTVACVSAVEAALGLTPPAPTRRVRGRLVALEAIEQTLWRLLVDLPPLVGETPPLAAMAGLRRALAGLRGALAPTPAWAEIGGAAPSAEVADAARALAAAAHAAVFGETDPAVSLADPAAYATWAAAGTTSTARLVRAVGVRGWSGFGASEVRPLPALALDDLARRLAADHDGGFRAGPTLNGQAHETGAWARRHLHALPASVAARHGIGVAARLAARLVDLAAMLDGLVGLTADDVTSLAAIEAAPVAPDRAAPGVAAASVETARGRLVHLVKIADGRLADHRMVAPTDWTLHRAGALARGLAGVTTGAPDDVSAAATLLAVLVDPCVACRIERAETARPA